MFYVLIILGVLIIALGIYKEKGNISFFTNNEFENKIELNEINHLKLRIENIENILFFSEPVITEEKEIEFETLPINYQVQSDEETLDDSSLNIYKTIRRYEKENYTLEEICSLLDMKKGEVLLLKNLYKDYPL